MHLVPAFVAMAAVTMISVPAPARHVDVAPAAAVKFTNSTAGTASVRANGVALFNDVAAGQTTDWSNFTDSMVTFVMVTSESPADSASVSQKIEEGARYTLVGTVMQGKPSLSISASQATDTLAIGTPRR